MSRADSRTVRASRSASNSSRVTYSSGPGPGSGSGSGRGSGSGSGTGSSSRSAAMRSGRARMASRNWSAVMLWRSIFNLLSGLPEVDAPASPCLRHPVDALDPGHRLHDALRLPVHPAVPGDALPKHAERDVLGRLLEPLVDVGVEHLEARPGCVPGRVPHRLLDDAHPVPHGPLGQLLLVGLAGVVREHHHAVEPVGLHGLPERLARVVEPVPLVAGPGPDGGDPQLPGLVVELRASLAQGHRPVDDARLPERDRRRVAGRLHGGLGVRLIGGGRRRGLRLLGRGARRAEVHERVVRPLDAPEVPARVARAVLPDDGVDAGGGLGHRVPRDAPRSARRRRASPPRRATWGGRARSRPRRAASGRRRPPRAPPPRAATASRSLRRSCIAAIWSAVRPTWMSGRRVTVMALAPASDAAGPGRRPGVTAARPGRRPRGGGRPSRPRRSWPRRAHARAGPSAPGTSPRRSRQPAAPPLGPGGRATGVLVGPPWVRRASWRHAMRHGAARQ